MSQGCYKFNFIPYPVSQPCCLVHLYPNFRSCVTGTQAMAEKSQVGFTSCSQVLKSRKKSVKGLSKPFSYGESKYLPVRCICQRFQTLIYLGWFKQTTFCLLHVLWCFSWLRMQFKENPPHTATFFFSFSG